MTKRPDIYDPAEANSKNVENLKEQLQKDDREFYE